MNQDHDSYHLERKRKTPPVQARLWPALAANIFDKEDCAVVVVSGGFHDSVGTSDTTDIYFASTDSWLPSETTPRL